MTRPVLTPVEQALYDVLLPDLRAGRRAPTYQALAARLGMASKGNVSRLVHSLADKGYVTCRPNAKQSLALAPEPDSITIRLAPELLHRVDAFLGPWASTRDDLIAKALTEFFVRFP